MDDDYVNKQIVCPTCGGRDMLYIDLNEIKADPKASTGTVTRAFSHQDHLLLLDIDHQGDIRAVNQIDKKQKIQINQEKYLKIREYMGNYDKILFISGDYHLELVFQREIDTIENDHTFSLLSQSETIELKMPSRHMKWLKNLTEKLLNTLSTDWKFLLLEVEDLDLFNHLQLQLLIKSAETIVTRSTQIVHLVKQLDIQGKIILL